MTIMQPPNISLPASFAFDWAGGIRGCPLCGRQLQTLFEENIDAKHDWSAWGEDWGHLYFICRCDPCNWWTICYIAELSFWEEECYAQCASFSSMQDFSLSDKDIPLAMLDAYVKSHYEVLEIVHPRKFEELVTSIFREHGFECELTCYSKDGGVDIIVFRHNGAPTAIQVKRYRKDRKIGIAEVHQFLGAMVAEGYKRGAIVTSSYFTRGAKQLPQNRNLNDLCVELELIDIDRLKEYASSTPTKVMVEPWEAAWAHRKTLPNAFSLAGWGQWGLLKAPYIPMSQYQMDRWLNQYYGELGYSTGDDGTDEPREDRVRRLSELLTEVPRGTLLHVYDRFHGHPSPAYPLLLDKLVGESLFVRTSPEADVGDPLPLEDVDDIGVHSDHPLDSDCREVALRWGA